MKFLLKGMSLKRDFTPNMYRQLLVSLQAAGYAFFTFEEWCEGKAHGRYVILRHDVDLKVRHSLAMAKIEAEMGARASYYFRVVPQSNQPHIIRAIADLGHEIAYHYEDMSLFNGNIEKALAHFKKQLAYFRQFYPVRTISMHGSPASKWDNRDLWKNYNYRDFGIIGEPYFDFLVANPELKNNIRYFTDTARMWDGDQYNVRDKITVVSTQHSVITPSILEHAEKDSGKADVNSPMQPIIHSTYDFIGWLETNPSVNVMMITTHPQRWTENAVEWLLELILQRMKNSIKRLFYV